MEDFSSSKDHFIARGKRTKRPRSSSAAADFDSHASSSFASSPTTEQDEDLANCLILLARGALTPKSEDRAESEFASRKFVEMAAAADAKIGVYVYECKTCSRRFSSFQALGGHRASHKKPKPAPDSDQKKKALEVEEEEVKFAKIKTVSPPPSTPQHADNRAKIHECSICGSEFASGQALGGHMRRHRSGPNSAAAKSSGDDSSHHPHHVEEKAMNMLTLDLNLPASPEEDCRESFQQRRLVFPAAALVDCHY